MPIDNDREAAGPAGRKQVFTLYAANGRLYARNVNQKIIDIGAVTRTGSGAFHWLLDGNQQGGEAFTEEEALRDVGRNVRFLWLDGQFTAVADAREGGELNLDGAAQVDIELDELKPGERMYDATV